MGKLNHKGTINIKTEHLILRPFKKSDGFDMYKNWASNSDVAKYVTWLPHENIETSTQCCELWESESENIDNYNWAICLNNEAIGSISVVNISDEINEATMGYCISKKHWGKGYMTECLSTIINFLFNEVGFNKISAQYNTKNPASGCVMEKCGMKFEGISWSGGLTNTDELCDLAYYSILYEDYNK